MAAKTIANLTAVISANNTKFKSGVKGAKGSLSGFQKSLKSMGPMIAGAFSVVAIKNFTTSSIKAYDTQIKAEKQLLTALKGRQGATQMLIQQAANLQQKTLFGDEETIRAQALIAAFVKEEDQIRTIIPLVQDLATAKGMDLAGAADLVSKTLGSSTNALSRYGIQVEGAVGSTERLDSLVRGLTEAFGGQAEAMAQVDMQLTSLKNAAGDFQEALVNVAQSNDTLLGGMAGAAQRDLSQLADYLNWMADKPLWYAKEIAVEFMESLTDMSAEDRQAALAVKLEEVRAKLERARNEYKAYGIAAETANRKDRKELEKSQDAAKERIDVNYELVKILESEVTATEDGVEANVKKADSIAGIREEITELKKVRDNASLSEVAQLNREIKLLEDKLKLYQNIGREASPTPGAGAGAIGMAPGLGVNLGEPQMITDEMFDQASEKYKQTSSDVQEFSQNFEKAMGVMSQAATRFGYHMGQVFSGSFETAEDQLKAFKETLADLASMILGSVGDIMIMAGLEMGMPQGLPLIIGGLGFKVAGGIAAGGGSWDQNGMFYSQQSAQTNSSVLYGNDIVTAYDYAATTQSRVG